MLAGSKFPILQLAEKIALYYHEHFADSFDVITHERLYKRARQVQEAIAEINSKRGRQFDPYLDVLTGPIHAEGLCSEALQALRAAVGKSAMSASRQDRAPAIPGGY
jgi:hypothetical protein